MSRILFVTSSLFGAASESRKVALELVDALRRTDPRAVVAERDLTPEAMPHLGQETLNAVAVPAEQRTAAQRRLASFADTLIEEVEAADMIVLAAPMYNFTVPSTLKAWLDHVARAGRTFRYTAEGPVGLLKNKKVFVVTGRGGIYSEGPARALDFQEPYLRAMFAFVGLDDVRFIHVEGLKISPDAAKAGIARARQAIGQMVPMAA